MKEYVDPVENLSDVIGRICQNSGKPKEAVSVYYKIDDGLEEVTH